MRDPKDMQQSMRKSTEALANANLEQTQENLKEIAEKILVRGMLPKDAIGFTDSMVEGLYAQAYRLYNTGKYVEASHIFRMLILLNTTESKYILGLAACFHMLKEYKNAIQAYTMCGIMDPENPIPHYHAADCYIHMKDPLSAIVSLEMAIKRAENKPEYNTIKDRSKMSIESLKKEIPQKE